jgi:hypothetical protein
VSGADVLIVEGTMHKSMLVHHVRLGYKLELYRIVIGAIGLKVGEAISRVRPRA